jgi:hypothetical protein
VITPSRLRAGALQALALVALVTAVLLTTPVIENNGGFDSDGRNYGAMAGEPSLSAEFAHQPPWCYRVLTPALASLLPGPILDRFRVLAFVSSVATLALFLGILRALAFAPLLSWIGVLLYAGVFWALKFAFYSPAYIDFQTQLLLMLVILLTLRRAWWVLVPVLALAVLQKESLGAFALFPVAALFRSPDGPRGARRAVRVAALVAAPVAAWLAVHALVKSSGSYSAAGVIEAEVAQFTDPLFWVILLQSLFSGLGVLPALLVLRPRPWLAFLRKEWHWSVFAALSLLMLLGGVDKSRLMLYFLPLAVILVLHSVAAYFPAGQNARIVLWAAAAIPVHYVIGSYLLPMDTFLDFLDRLVPEHSPGGFLFYLGLNLGLSALVMVLTWMMWAPRREPAAARRGARRAAG